MKNFHFLILLILFSHLVAQVNFELDVSLNKLDALDEVIEVAEKKVISNHATVGIYWYKHGKDFVEAAEEMIRKNIRVNNEFYVCPVFNEMIGSGKNVGIYQVEKMLPMGTPLDLMCTTKELM